MFLLPFHLSAALEYKLNSFLRKIKNFRQFFVVLNDENIFEKNSKQMWKEFKTNVEIVQ